MSQVPYPREDSGVPTFLSIEPEHPFRRIERALAVSVSAHIVVFALLVVISPYLPATRATNSLVTLRRQATELILPPQPLTQKEPSRGALSKEFTVESIQPHDNPNRIPSPGAAPRPALTGKQFKVPGAPIAQPKPVLPDAPEIQMTGPELSQLSVPKIQIEEKPKLAFETPGQRALVPKAPIGTLEEAIRGSTRGGGGGLTVGDTDDGLSAPSPGMRPSPTGGKLGSSLQLLSDPQGADFRPYLAKLLSAVRRNWMAIIPESARFGRQGRVVVRFSVLRDGSVQQFQITNQSGTEAFDKAAVAGISASHPFPPLPTDFKGGWVRLQLTFLYNLQP